MNFSEMTFKAFIKRLSRVALIPKVQRGIIALEREEDIVSKELVKVLKEILENLTDSEEKVWINRIESLRKELNASGEEISIVDYGAGSPALNFTNEQMYEGRVVIQTIGDVCRQASKSYLSSFLLFKLIRQFRPSICLELGTCLGISTSYQAAALKLNQLGRIVTLEGSESLGLLAQKHFQALELDNVNIVFGRFQDTLDKVMNAYKPINYAFIDGHHDEKATLFYFEQICPFLSEKAVLVFDDISWSRGMKKAWRVIATDKRVKISVDLRTMGICLIDSSIPQKPPFQIPIL
jgi:predicted O-methyltransferase YrrM